MSFDFECGLVVGKFAPLHRGHQYLIDTALSQCRQVILLSYSNPELPGCAPERREAWLARLYPQTTRLVVTNERLAQWFPGQQRVIPPNSATDDEHREFTAELIRHVACRSVDAVFTSESYGEGFAACLDRYFRRFDPSARPVRHVLVDESRRSLPTSGTSIRADVHAAREWLHPAVYASFVERVVCLGGESSGKSTLTEALARKFGTLHAPEFGRELWVERGGNLTFDDLLLIAQTQVTREERLAEQSNHYLFCDTSPLTTLFYCQDLFGRAAPELTSLAGREYLLTVLCAPDFEFVQDGTRRESGFRLQQHDWYVRQLRQRGIRYIEVRGSVESRVEQVVTELRGVGATRSDA
ncbi:AAA family ATPase [Steroidobacter sp.]|uniref:AAA family ATPase n=1 Tax=Steroidobacter sp. TaxID=1978227 RepID=UPI001A63F44C|nr:AAA family ATPase [Steroidobacter sp.]MBL8270416.1 AAA family ATPase [Steroidobacter sp.]